MKSKTLPGTFGKKGIILDTVESMSKKSLSYLAYMANLTEFKEQLAHIPNLKNYLSNVDVWLLHWAVGHPYDELLKHGDATIDIENRIGIVRLILDRLKLETNNNIEIYFGIRNHWCETILHCSVASENLSDDDTYLLTRELLSYLNEKQQQKVLHLRTNEAAKPSEYARWLGKHKAAHYLELKAKPSSAQSVLIILQSPIIQASKTNGDAIGSELQLQPK